MGGWYDTEAVRASLSTRLRVLVSQNRCDRPFLKIIFAIAVLSSALVVAVKPCSVDAELASLARSR